MRTTQKRRWPQKWRLPLNDDNLKSENDPKTKEEPKNYGNPKSADEHENKDNLKSEDENSCLVCIWS